MKSTTAVPVTVAVVALDAGEALPALLTSLQAQTAWPAEIVVVDRGSSDDTVLQLSTWAPPPSMVFSVIQAVGASVSESRNVAIEAAAFDRVLLTDATAIPDPTWVESLWRGLEAGADVVGGQVRVAGSTALQTAIATASIPARQVDPDAVFVPAGINIAFRVPSWDAVGGYPEWLAAGQDTVFAAALREAGMRIAYVPGAVTSWRPSGGVSEFLGAVFRSARACGRAGVTEHRSASGIRTRSAGPFAANKLKAARLAVHVLAAATAAAGQLAGRVAARLLPDPVHVRITGRETGFEQGARRVRWYPFDEQQIMAHDGPQVTSVRG